MPPLFPGEWEPEKTAAELRAEADSHRKESETWIMHWLEGEDQRKALGQLRIWYLRRMTAINTQGQLS